MEVRLGKWEKNGIQRIYFNAQALGNSKAYAYVNKDGLFALGQQVYTPGQNAVVSDVQNSGVEAIEKLLGRPIMHDTKFADVWAVI